MTGILLCLTIFGLVGWAARRLLGNVEPFLAGLGTTAFALFVAGVADVPLIPTLIALLVLSLVVILTVKGIDDESRIEYPMLPTVIALAATLWLTGLSISLPLVDYDGRAFWLLKAKAVAHELDVDGPFFHDRTSVSIRNTYPLLVPIDAAVIMLSSREHDDHVVRFMYVLFAIGFAGAIRDGLGRLTDPTIGAWAAALFLWLPQIGPEPDGGALTGSADIALGAFVACAFFELVRGDAPLRFGFWLPMIALTKSEGLPLAFLLFLIGCATFRRKALISALPFSVGLLFLGIWKRGLERSDESDYVQLIWNLPDQLPLFFRVLGDFTSQIWALHDWGIFWIAVVLGAIWSAVRRRWRPLALAAVTIVPPVMLYAAVIAVTDWDLYRMTDSVAPRLMTHLIGPAMLLLGTGLVTRERTSGNGSPEEEDRKDLLV